MTIESGDCVPQTLSDWQVFFHLCHMVAGYEIAETATAVSVGRAWHRLWSLAHDQQCMPAVASSLTRHPEVLATLPTTLSEKIVSVHKSSIQRNLGLYAQAIKLTRVLNCADIEPIFLKGTAALLTREAGDIGARSQLDIDILVPPQAIDMTCQLLLADGYRFTNEDNNGAFDYTTSHSDTPLALRQSRNHHHLTPLTKDGCRSCVELHKYHLPVEFSQQALLEAMLATAASHKVNGARFKVPDSEHRLIQLILGSYVHDRFAHSQDFPIRAGIDFLHILQLLPAAARSLVETNAARHCAPYWEPFNSLVNYLFTPSDNPQIPSTPAQKKAINRLRKRYEYPGLGSMLDAWARLRQLMIQLRYNPAKLNRYLESSLSRAIA